MLLNQRLQLIQSTVIGCIGDAVYYRGDGTRPDLADHAPAGGVEHGTQDQLGKEDPRSLRCQAAHPDRHAPLGRLGVAWHAVGLDLKAEDPDQFENNPKLRSYSSTPSTLDDIGFIGRMHPTGA